MPILPLQRTIIPAEQNQSTETDELDSELAMTSSGYNGNSKGTMELLYHGSCSECHHFHRYVPFKMSSNEEDHTRFCCDACRHPIFGLGRRETQITLASQDSFPVIGGQVAVPSEGSCIGRPEPLPGLQIDTSVQSSGRHVQDPLSAIREQPSPAQPNLSSTRELSHVSENRTHERIFNPPFTMSTPRTQGTPSQSSNTCTGYHFKRPSFIWRSIYRLVGRFAKSLGGTPHELRFLGLRLYFQLTSEYLDRQYASSLPTTQSNNSRHDSPARLLSDNQDPSSLEAGDLCTEQHEEVHGLPPPTTNTRAQPPLESTNPETAGPEIDVSSPEGKLKSHRRDKTLRKRAMNKRCHCTKDCYCKLNDRISSMGHAKATENITQPRSFTQWSDQVSTKDDSNSSRPNARPDPLTQLGEHFSLRPRHRPGLCSSATNNRYRRNRTSFIPSDPSTISLSSGRPRSAQRSLSASTVQPLATNSQIDSVRRVLEELHAMRNTAADPDVFPWHSSNTDIAQAARNDTSLQHPISTDAEVSGPSDLVSHQDHVFQPRHPPATTDPEAPGSIGLASHQDHVFQHPYPPATEQTEGNILGESTPVPNEETLPTPHEAASSDGLPNGVAANASLTDAGSVS